MATFAVDTTNDSVAVDLVTGLDVNGNVSIRSAIMAANSQPGNHVINVPFSANPYQLFIGGQGENFAASGDLDIRSTIEINAPANTVLDAQNIDRVFEVQSIGNLTINGLQLTGGLAVQGGGIYNRGVLSINNATVSGTAGELVLTATAPATIVIAPINAYGGAIFNAAGAEITVLNSFVYGTARASDGVVVEGAPGTRGGHAYGGGIYNLGRISGFNSTINGVADAGGGGSGANGANGVDSIEGAPATNGQAGLPGGAGGFAYGGSIYNGPSGELYLGQTTIDGLAFGGAGGRGGDGGSAGSADATSGNAAAQAGVGGNGGAGGLAYGAGIYNVGGLTVFTDGDQGSSRIRAQVYGGAGGDGGWGGNGGSGDVNVLTDQVASGSNGGAGGVGGSGGVAWGGAIHVASGTVNVALTEMSGIIAEQNLGAYGGYGGAGGQGGVGGDVFVSPGNGAGGTGARGGRGGSAEGGGLYMRTGVTSMSSVRVEAHEAIGGNAGRSGNGGNATLGDWGISSTGATGAVGLGGVIAIRGGTINIERSQFSLNEAIGGDGGGASDGSAAGIGGLAQGGAIFMAAGELNLSNTYVERNNARGGFGGFADLNFGGVNGTDGGIGGSAQGGGLASIGGLASVETSTFDSNQAIGGNGADGSVGNSSAIADPAQVGGDGGRGGSAAGGALYTTGGSTFVRNTTIHGNRVKGGPGGAGGPAQMLGDIPVAPFGLAGGAGLGRGGGSFHTGTGLLSFDSVTVARNAVDDTLGSGAGLYNVGGTVQVHNTLIALNTLAAGNPSNNWDAVGAFSSQGYNIISVRNGTSGFTAVGDRRGLSTAPLDVQLGPLQFNGGLTPTAELLFSSIAINAGDPINFLPTDQSNVPRFGRADIGASEFVTIQEN